jgi:Spy/CpxP family protein refolding chaperone
MKSFIKVLFSVLALGLMAAAPLALRAQDAPPADGGGKKGGKGKGGGMLTVERIEQAVGTLTDDQKTKIGDILAKAQKDVQALAPEDRAKGRDIQMAARKDVRAVLTPDQQTKFDEMPMGGKGKKKQN